MEIYTKLFLINFVVLVAVLIVDKNTNDNLEKYMIVNFWSGSTLLSIPAYIIYLIATS